MARSVAIIDGHPDPDRARLCHALSDAYATGAQQAGHHVARIDVAGLDFPVLRTKEAFDHGTPVAGIAAAQATIEAADHLVIVFPLWLGTMPALLKAFLEQTFRPGWSFHLEPGGLPKPALKGRSARIVITMGMPAFAYRWFFFAHSVKNLERNILKFVGIRPVQWSLFGSVEAADADRCRRWLGSMERLGRRAG